MNIREIEALTVKEVEGMKKDGKAELLNIKDHLCYLVDLQGNFGYSVLVFKNNHHIYYANDYQLHHGTKTIEELKQWYIKTLNNKLFSESELMEEVQTYDEYKKKSYYVRNYWIMQFDYVSAFYIGKPEKKLQEAKEKMLFCPTCFCYVEDKNIIYKAGNFIRHIEESFTKVKENPDIFRKMVSYELSNHEAGYTCDYSDALETLGFKFEELTEEHKHIVKEELKKQIENCF
jgi:hypothetical protein